MKASGIWTYFAWAYLHFWFAGLFHLFQYNLVYPWWLILVAPKDVLKKHITFLVFVLSNLIIGLYANLFRLPDLIYFAIKNLTQNPKWATYPPEPFLKQWLGTLALFTSMPVFIIFFCWYDIPRCIGWGEGWYKAQKTIAGKIGFALRWGVGIPLLLWTEYWLFQRLLETWPQLITRLPMWLAEIHQPMHSDCPVSYWDFLVNTWQAWLGFTLSLALGVYVAPRAWLRHLRTGAWSAVGRSAPLALLQALLALYFVLVWPLRLTYGFVARVTCDARFLVPPPPLDTLFALLHPALFWGAVDVLALLLWRCRHRGQCVPGLREAFPRWTGTSRKPLLSRRKPHDG